MHFKITGLVFIFCWLCFSIKSQSLADSSSIKLLYSIQYRSDSVFKLKPGPARDSLHTELLNLWDQLIACNRPMELPWDSLKKHYSVLISPDRLLMVISWNLPQGHDLDRYFGYIVKAPLRQNNFFGLKRRKRLKNEPKVPLISKLQEQTLWYKTKPEFYSGNKAAWPGMLYTALIPCDSYYLLLGWNAKNRYSQFKCIEVLWFDSKQEPVFGKNVFKLPKKNPKRLVFEYSKEAQMSLRFDPGQNRIIYSHLGPVDENPAMTGQFAFYGPDGSFDALNEHDNRWILEEAIDVRNKRNKNDYAPKPNHTEEIQLYPRNK